MQVVAQNLDDILLRLQPLTIGWQDDISRRVIAEIEAMPVKKVYTLDDVGSLLDKPFEDALLIFRLFLGLSKDTFTGLLRDALRGGASGSQATGPIDPSFWMRSYAWRFSKPWQSKRTAYHNGAIFW